MRLKLKYRFFIILLAASIVIIACMFLLTRLSFKYGFLSYVDQMETKRLGSMCRILEEAYGDEGSWQFLKVIANHPGIIFTRDRLMDHIYPDGRIVSDRTVDSHIRKLLKKLKRSFREVRSSSRSTVWDTSLKTLYSTIFQGNIFVCQSG